MTDQPDCVVLGGGPAGLMAAEALLAAGLKVVVTEAKPSFARKFLMAGKSGLNVTKDEPLAAFAQKFDSDWLAPMLADFGPAEVMDWCRALNQEVFTGSSGRVFPTVMKGSPLLRAWLARLQGQGADLRARWQWQGWQGQDLAFQTPAGLQVLSPRCTILALGGASWPRLGSDGAWQPWLAAKGVEVAPFQPANMGFVVAWSPHMQRYFGMPIKGGMLRAGTQQERGEFVISANGLEGGGIYAISRVLREGAPLTYDFFPDLDPAALAARLARIKPGESLPNRLRKLGLTPAAAALVMEFGRTLPLDRALKALPLPLQGPRPLAEAISTAGGVTRASVTAALELKAIPGTYVCGEMLNWEAPTGGYLLTGAWASGLWAGRQAARAMQNQVEKL